MVACVVISPPRLNSHQGMLLQGRQAAERCGCPLRSAGNRCILGMLPASVGC